MPHTPGHSPFDIYALRGEGGEQISSAEIEARRAREQARTFQAPPPPPGMVDPNPAASAAAFSAPSYPFPDSPSSIANPSMAASTIPVDVFAREEEALSQRRMEEERRIEAERRLRELEERINQMSAGAQMAPSTGAFGAGTQVSPDPEVRRTTPRLYAGLNTAGFQMGGGQFGDFAPLPSAPQQDTGALIDPMDIARRDFAEPARLYVESGGEFNYQLIQEALRNFANQPDVNLAPDASYLLSRVGIDSRFLLDDLFREFNNATQGPNARMSPEEFLFRFTGTGPGTKVGEALNKLALAEGNLSALLPADRATIEQYQVANGAIPNETLRLYGIPTSTPPREVVGGGVSSEQGVAGEQGAGTGGGAMGPPQAGGAGQINTEPITLNAGQQSAIFQAGYDAIEALRAGQTGVRLPDEIFQIAANDAATGKTYSTAQNIIESFDFGVTPEADVQVANIQASTAARELDLAEDRATREFQIANNQILNTARQIDNEFNIALGDLELRQLAQAQQNQIQQSRLAFDERNARANRALESELAAASNRTNIDIANIQSEATRFVATENGLAARDVALFNKASATEVAEITGLSKAQVANIQGQYNRQVASLTGLSQQEVARIQGANQLAVEKERLSSQETISNNQLANAIKLAGINNTSTQAIAAAQNAAALAVATANNTSAGEIAKLQGDDAFKLSQMQISEQFKGEAEIAKVQSEYQKELAKLTGATEEQIASIQAQSNEDINNARIAGEKEAYTAQQAFQSQEAQAQRTFESGEAGAQRTFQQQQAQLDRDAQAENVRLQFLNGLQPAEFAELQRDIARGGLTVEQSENLAALVARGGLTAEERLAEMNAESRTDEMNTLISLLSNPQALGAFVTAISGELPFETVPTMGQLAEMTPNRIQYLQGALSALGIDPSTFVRMAQSVTPQAFQESGPFSQISAMIA
tara:strand:+ start:1354 stop:4176 length:2823 start_codon:yes stop_codon:yes gene_type:complete